MTKQQEIMVERIKRYIEKHDLFNNDPRYEFKEFSVEETDYGTVIVYSVTGLKNDEGTMAAIFCRNKRHIFIGKRGGLKSSKWDSKKNKSINLQGWSDVMIYGCSH
jgi:hypothetical protein